MTSETRDREAMWDAEVEAQRLADRTMAGAEPMDWREAGYDSALDAAHALVGSAGSGESAIIDRAAEIVAERICR